MGSEEDDYGVVGEGDHLLAVCGEALRAHGTDARWYIPKRGVRLEEGALNKGPPHHQNKHSSKNNQAQAGMTSGIGCTH